MYEICVKGHDRETSLSATVGRSNAGDERYLYGPNTLGSVPASGFFTSLPIVWDQLTVHAYNSLIHGKKMPANDERTN